MENMQNSHMLIYTTEDGLTKIDTTFDEDTVWLSIDQMAELFQRDKSTISRHIKNIFPFNFLRRCRIRSTMRFMDRQQLTLKEAVVAINYLNEKELRSMGQFVSGYLDFAERQAEREQVVTMQDWTDHLERILYHEWRTVITGEWQCIS